MTKFINYFHIGFWFLLLTKKFEIFNLFLIAVIKILWLLVDTEI